MCPFITFSDPSGSEVTINIQQIAYIVSVEANTYQVHFVNGGHLSLSTQRGTSLLDYVQSLTLLPKEASAAR
jgi:hypothetical protein